ncbi:MAG: Rne/Rng family ribonuclease, partial [Fibrobacterota bacterium]
MKRIVINEAPHETRILITEDGKLCDLLVERPENSRIAGNIYKGTVNKVLPGLQAAFIEIGMEKAAFLHLSDINKHQDLDLILE